MEVHAGFPNSTTANNGWKLYFTTVILTIAAGLFVIARYATRILKQSLGSDDYAMLAALLFSVFTGTSVLLAIENGYGQHMDDLSEEQARKALEWFFIAQTPYKVTVCLNKASMLLLYTHIFVQKRYQVSCWIILEVVICWSVGTIFSTIFQCLPIAASWNKSLDGDCIDRGVFWIAYAVGNVLTDMLVLTVPISPVMALHLPRRERLLLCGVFLLGGFVTITSILRTTAVSNSLRNQQDITYNFITRGIWTLVEANLGIICACLPILKQPLACLLPWLFRGSTRAFSYNIRGAGYTASNATPRDGFHSEEIHDPSSSSRKLHAARISARPNRHSDEDGIILEEQQRAPRASESTQSTRSREHPVEDKMVSVVTK